MATRAKVIRNFFKKFFDIDAKGMSEVAVVRDVLKKKYNVDANGNSVISLLQNVIENNESIVEPDGGGGMPSMMIALGTNYTDEEPCGIASGAIIKYPAQVEGGPCVLGNTLSYGVIDGAFINGRWYSIYELGCRYENEEIGLSLGEFTVTSTGMYHDVVAQMEIDCDDPRYQDGETITVNFTVTIDGVDYTQPITLTIHEWRD